MRENINKLTIFLVCVCVALGIALALEHYKYAELQQQNLKMERQVKEMSVQVNEIWAEHIGMMKRLQQHGGAVQ